MPRQPPAGWLVPALALCVAGLVFMALGDLWVSFFAALALLCCGRSSVSHARHALDGETVTLTGTRIEVEQRCGLAITRTTFDGVHTVVRCLPWAGSVWLNCAGRTAFVGRELSRRQRERFAHEFALALRAARQPASASALLLTAAPDESPCLGGVPRTAADAAWMGEGVAPRELRQGWG